MTRFARNDALRFARNDGAFGSELTSLANRLKNYQDSRSEMGRESVEMSESPFALPLPFLAGGNPSARSSASLAGADSPTAPKQRRYVCYFVWVLCLIPGPRPLSARIPGTPLRITHNSTYPPRKCQVLFYRVPGFNCQMRRPFPSQPRLRWCTLTLNPAWGDCAGGACGSRSRKDRMTRGQGRAKRHA